jgi:DNA-binding NarL/FixJ family response regulator
MDKPFNKLYITDDHPIIIKGIIQEFDSLFKTIYGFENGQSLINQLEIEKPSHLIIDINIPVKSGLEVLNYIKRKGLSDINTVVYSMYNSSSLIKKCIFLGANGFVLKTSSNQEIIEAFNCEDFYFSKDLSKPVKPSNVIDAPPFITQREMDVIKLLVNDLGSKEIARQLNVSEHTVQAHRKNLRKKLNVTTTAGLVNYCYENGLIYL